MKANTVLIVLLSSLFMTINHSVAMVKMVSHVPKDIDDALRQFNATKLEDFLTSKEVLNDIPHASFSDLHAFFLANTSLLHHPKMRLALEQRLKKESCESLKCALNNYRAFAKNLYDAIKLAYAKHQVSDVLRQAIETEIAYYDLLLATTLYHKETLARTPIPGKTTLFSCLSCKIALGVSVTIAGALAYYGYTTYKKEAVPVNPKK